jgi:hypothetical protein
MPGHGSRGIPGVDAPGPHLHGRSLVAALPAARWRRGTLSAGSVGWRKHWFQAICGWLVSAGNLSNRTVGSADRSACPGLQRASPNSRAWPALRARDHRPQQRLGTARTERPVQVGAISTSRPTAASQGNESMTTKLTSAPPEARNLDESRVAPDIQAASGAVGAVSARLQRAAPSAVSNCPSSPALAGSACRYHLGPPCRPDR